MTSGARGLPVSVQVRLARHARAIGVDPNLILARFAVERFLYRLSRSPHADRFVLKGALLMLVWLGDTIRPTRDADLLGLGEITPLSLKDIFTEVCGVDVEPDGMVFEPSTIRVEPIRTEDAYGGLRVTLRASLGKASIRVQIDVGVGDAVTPAPVWLDYPALLDLPGPRLRAYRPETAIAEKLHAMVVLGEANSRMRDFFDIYALLEASRFLGADLASAVRATFERRRTPVPDELPIALGSGFAGISGKQTQWRAFLRKSRIVSAPEDLDSVVARIATFLEPVIEAAREQAALRMEWPPGGPWKE